MQRKRQVCMLRFTYRIDRNNIFQSASFPGRRRRRTFSIALHFISRCFCGCHKHLASITAQTFFAALLYSFHAVRRMYRTSAIRKCRIEKGIEETYQWQVNSKLRLICIFITCRYLLLEVILWRVNMSYQHFCVRRYAFLSIFDLPVLNLNIL